VSDTEPPPLDRATILATFARHDVQYVLVGGLASQAHGATRVTKDLDACPAWTSDNLARVAAALTELQARMKIGEGSVDTLEVNIDARTIHNTELGAWRTIAGDIDVLLGIPSTSRWELARYDQLAKEATVIEIDGQHIPVASLDDIIRSKEIADRPKDREALDELRTLRDRQRETERQPEPPDTGDTP
jgi:hypothetical protein